MTHNLSTSAAGTPDAGYLGETRAGRSEAMPDGAVTHANAWPRLQRDVIQAGLCTHCGTCVGLSQGQLTWRETGYGPLPVASNGHHAMASEQLGMTDHTPFERAGIDDSTSFEQACIDDSAIQLSPLAYRACPGKGLNYPSLNRFLFGDEPANWLIGNYRQIYIGYSAHADVRRRGASGGVITQTLLHLLAEGAIQGAIVVRQGTSGSSSRGSMPTTRADRSPWQARPTIARTAEEILAASQSVYAPVPVNSILAELETFDGDVAYVGLPDQVASLRFLQQAGHPVAQKVRYVLGPYVGTNMYQGAIASFLRSHHVAGLHEIAELRYRDGEWPGHLMIRLHDGRILRAEKFYYNYLIPFYITRSTLYAVDFTNELTDISVGDAWHPRYETQGGGFSVVVARTAAGETLLAAMQQAGHVHLEPVELEAALAMHGHMLDFKKRGAFIRMDWRKAAGQIVPDYGYRPARIPLSRKAVEVVIALIFLVCGTPVARRLVEWIPISILGPLFNSLRKSWKTLSKPSKRRGLAHTDYVVTEISQAPQVEDKPSWKLQSSRKIYAAARHLLQRTWIEIQHWRRPAWDFAAVGAHWDATEEYDDINEETYSYFRRFTDGLRLSDLEPQGHVLDLCARTGNGTLYFHQNGKVASAICADVSAGMGEICRQRLHENGFHNFTWLRLFDYPLPLSSNIFDSILCFETVEHVAHPERLVAELGRVIKPGGVMILTTPNVLWEPVHALAAITGLHHSEGPHRFLRYQRLLEMVRAAGFTIETCETTVLIPGGPGWLVRLGEWIEERTRTTLMPWLGLRRVLICRRLSHKEPTLQSGVNKHPPARETGS